MRHTVNFRMHGACVLAACMALILPGCKPAMPDASPAATTAPASVDPAPAATAAPATADTGTTATATIDTQWQCGDQRVAARFDNAAQTVAVVHDRGEVVLPQAISASGARYADANGNEFWTKGAGGTLTLSGTPPRECTQVGAGG